MYVEVFDEFIGSKDYADLLVILENVPTGSSCDKKKYKVSINNETSIKCKETFTKFEKGLASIEGIQSDPNTIEELVELIEKVKTGVPYIRDDSLRAWTNMAAELFCLTIGDIKKLSPGDKLELLYFTDDIDSFTDLLGEGETYNPRDACYYVTYTHKSGFSGHLEIKDICDFEDFKWSVNGFAIDEMYYWGEPFKPYDEIPDYVCAGKDGPMIRLSDLEYLPNTVTNYGNCYEDSSEQINVDLSKCKT